MSEIDSYRNRCIGIVTCPSRFPLIPGRERDGEEQPGIPLYRLDEDALDANSFRGKRGDVLMGGGSGEHPALRIAIPEAFYCFTHPDWVAFDTMAEIVLAFWSMTYAYLFGDGYQRIGWTPDKQIEHWLVEHILSYLVATYPDTYSPLLGPEPLGEDGSICRQPTAAEAQHWSPTGAL
jgi:hypothetical protein